MNDDRKVYVRHIQTGDRGYVGEDDEGKKVVYLDRPQDTLGRPYDESVWQLDRDTRPLTRFAVAQAAFQADSALCRALGEPNLNKGQWPSLSDKQRILWRDKGPTKDPVRAGLYRVIVDYLKQYSDPEIPK